MNAEKVRPVPTVSDWMREQRQPDRQGHRRKPEPQADGTRSDNNRPSSSPTPPRQLSEEGVGDNIDIRV